ncbi:YigZ family protein [Floccifex sp.]|uniref:YigZ family protein n=1 Tax=Floccifex sp. TaxID=2815810 RepID=UPI003F109A83
MPKIKEDSSNTIEIKKSKFITYLHRTNDEEDAKEFLKIIKKRHPDATHHCTAMVIGNIVRSNDDGEPAQTAGHPMLNVLLHEQMQDIFIVVVRYFGGIKLGTGGLVKAYSSSVQEALKKATLTEVSLFHEYEITFGYDWIGKVEAYFRKNNIEITSIDYNEMVKYKYISEQDLSKDLMELSNGAITPIWIQDIEKEKVI